MDVVGLLFAPMDNGRQWTTMDGRQWMDDNRWMTMDDNG
jgi:hypothetical protein